MMQPRRTKRRLLAAGLGAAAFTAIEGLACGNPLEPRCPTPCTIDAPTTTLDGSHLVDANDDGPHLIDAGPDGTFLDAINNP